jgi:hypothetical protein
LDFFVFFLPLFFAKQKNAKGGGLGLGVRGGFTAPLTPKPPDPNPGGPKANYANGTKKYKSFAKKRNIFFSKNSVFLKKIQ